MSGIRSEFDERGRWVVSGSEGVLVSYRFGKADGKPHCDSVRTAGGRELVCMRPADHPWHRGLWFSWKFIDGVNYWEEREDFSSEGSSEAEPPARLAGEGGGGAVALEHGVTYRDGSGRVRVREQRRIGVAMLEGGAWAMDWGHRFEAAEEGVVLERTPLTEQSWWGGYAGLSWRATRGMTGGRVTDSEGRKDKAAHHARARWADLSGQLDGGFGLSGGMTMLDHPGNVRHPTPWYLFLEPEFLFLQPAVLMDEGMRLGAGAVELRYRVVVHDGWCDAAQAEGWWRAWAGR